MNEGSRSTNKDSGKYDSTISSLIFSPVSFTFKVKVVEYVFRTEADKGHKLSLE